MLFTASRWTACAILGLVFLNERLDAFQWLAIAAIIAASIGDAPGVRKGQVEISEMA